VAGRLDGNGDALKRARVRTGGALVASPVSTVSAAAERRRLRTEDDVDGDCCALYMP
jgi:hypothetical protein